MAEHQIPCQVEGCDGTLTVPLIKGQNTVEATCPTCGKIHAIDVSSVWKEVDKLKDGLRGMVKDFNRRQQRKR